MPVWTDQEMEWLFLHPQSSVSVAQMRDAYTIVGGIPRLVKSPDVREKIRSGISNTTLNQVLSLPPLLLFFRARCCTLVSLKLVLRRSTVH